MKKSGIKKWIQRANRKTPKTNDYTAELKEWVCQVLVEAEKTGDIQKKNQFLALNAQL